jgi:hydrogenase maturation protein HypF
VTRLQQLPRAAPRRVLGLGAYLKNSACLLEGPWVHWSGHHGDLATPEACLALDASVRRLVEMAGGRIDAIAHDLHPDFESTRLALAWAARLGVPALAVQHHHAHLGVVQAEQGLGVAAAHGAELIGLALDGVGLGDDGLAWGGELLALSGSRCRRLGHLPALALPGGDVAAREPWRMAASLLHSLGRGDEIVSRLGPAVGQTLARGVADMLERRLRCPMTTSAGRWFDSMAGLLGLSVRQGGDAEAALALEAAAARWLDQHPDRRHWPDTPVAGLALWPLAEACRVSAEVSGPEAAAALFHIGLAKALAQAALAAAARQQTDGVVLSGGCFHNRVLVGLLSERLQQAGLRVLQPGAFSGPGDAGLALGQAWVGSLRLAASDSDAQDRGAQALLAAAPDHRRPRAAQAGAQPCA